ncbi:ATP-binding protein [Bacteroides sp. MSK.20.12]|uniref:ATP-binding protein n=1 Tax=Bacteroides sp. MSK.20.12 TaxID=2850324 RepID=UPI001C2752B9|nr:ATP-binding protein [Bacteroides sp. MSK.20.12]MBU9953715.1 ATP-binding protein [Bacteroides sp. MSK.20.12]
MPAINRIHICGFKAFPNDFELLLEGKNLLMYGENGSGKSSIYYALHCMFQAPLKPDAGKKYFDPASEQHLKNLNNLDVDSKIWIDFDGRHPFIYNIDKEGYQFTLLGGKHPLPAQINGCFVNHQFLFHFFNFRNSQRINLFPVFIKDILPFCKDDNTGLHIGEMYDEITASIIKKGRHIHPDYISNIEYFNKAVKKVVEDINIYASDRYNESFKDEDDNELVIRLRYDSNFDKPEDDTNEYWLKYDNIIELVKENGEIKERKSSYKKLNEPFIGLEISEKMPDGNLRKIVKPHTYFNEAKLTAIALSVRFALLNIEKPADGRFLALDDMLISLDMSNRAKVVDFLLKISDKYKIYLFTHDKMFFEYFKHKTKKNQDAWVYKEIYMDYDKTPYIRNSEDYLGQAEHYIKQHEYEIAGNFLRKEAEAFCKDFLPKKKQLTGDFAHLDLNGLIMNCKDYAAESGVIDISIFNELDEHRKFILNPSSHDSYDVAKYGHEVKRCLQTLRKLREIIIRPFLKFGSQVEFTLKTPEPRISEYKFILTLCDDFRIIIMPGEVPVISKGMINYQVYEDGNNKKGVQSDNTTIKHFFEYNYEKSDKTKDANYLISVIEIESGNPIATFM